MSYYTKIDVQFCTSDEVEELRAQALRIAVQSITDDKEGWASEAGWSTPDDDYFVHEIDEIRQALGGEIIQMHAYVDKIEALFQQISREMKDEVIGVRGLGEDFGDIWVRFFKNGIVYESFPR